MSLAEAAVLLDLEVAQRRREDPCGLHGPGHHRRVERVARPARRCTASRSRTPRPGGHRARKSLAPVAADDAPFLSQRFAVPNEHDPVSATLRTLSAGSETRWQSWRSRALRAARPRRRTAQGRPRRSRPRGGRLGRADDRRGHGRLAQHPGQRDLGPGDPAGLGDLGHRVDDPAGRRRGRASCRTGRSPTGRWWRPSPGSAGRGRAGSTGSRRFPRRGRAAASPAPPRAAAGCSGPAC